VSSTRSTEDECRAGSRTGDSTSFVVAGKHYARVGLLGRIPSVADFVWPHIREMRTNNARCGRVRRADDGL
jgi:hypothetical protein